MAEIMENSDYDAFCDWADLINLPEEDWDGYFEVYYQILKEEKSK